MDHLGNGRFILVGHSAGGPIVRAAAAARPERVAGMVLLDPSDEACAMACEGSLQKLERNVQRVSGLLARLGLLNLLYRAQLAAFPPDIQRELRNEAFTPNTMRTRGAELAGLTATFKRWREEPPRLPDIPVTVISAGRADAMGARLRAALTAAHAYRAQQSPSGRHVVAERSGHMLPIEDPDFVVAEIRRMLEAT